MKNVSVENGFRWMLAAWMLLATSVTSSTYVHDHSGGNLAHHHDKSDCPLSQSFASAASCGDYHNAVSLSAVDIHRHGRLVLLGSIAHQPMPDEPSGSHEKAPTGWETIAVSAAHGVRTFSKGLAVDHSGLATSAILSISCICESKQCEPRCAGVAPASPLCDRARHERSGVQLA